MSDHTDRKAEMKAVWETSFQHQIARGAYNTAPVEALVRTVAYHLRARYQPDDYPNLHFCEAGCGAGPNLRWLAEKGIKVSGVDISGQALQLAHELLDGSGRVGQLLEGSVTELPFADETFDGVLEACVFQHLTRDERKKAFNEVRRVLKPGGIFVGYQLGDRHTTFQAQRDRELPDDPGTVQLVDESNKSGFNLETIGLAHFFSRGEYADLLDGFSVKEPLDSTYELPAEEAQRRGYDHYLQHMWIVHAVK